MGKVVITRHAMISRSNGNKGTNPYNNEKSIVHLSAHGQEYVKNILSTSEAQDLLGVVSDTHPWVEQTAYTVFDGICISNNPDAFITDWIAFGNSYWNPTNMDEVLQKGIDFAAGDCVSIIVMRRNQLISLFQNLNYNPSTGAPGTVDSDGNYPDSKTAYEYKWYYDPATGYCIDGYDLTGQVPETQYISDNVLWTPEGDAKLMNDLGMA